MTLLHTLAAVQQEDYMDLTAILISQYLASLEMLKQTITLCPESLWDAGNKNKFWQVAYHALFFTHYYVQDSEATFTRWAKDQGEDEDVLLEPGEPYNRETILEYLAFCQQEVTERVPQLNLAEASPFHRQQRTRMELQIYSIRHIMQHTGELMERLADLPEEIAWVGSKHG